MVDASLDDDFDTEEARRFLKVGLLCTQDNPKLRPTMSAVVQMLMGLRDVDHQITKPGLISDFMDLKVKNKSEDVLPASSSLEGLTVSSSNTTNTSVIFNSTAEK